MPVNFTIESGVALNREFPQTFEIPPLDAHENLQVGDMVKLIFCIDVERIIHRERMWVVVKRLLPEYFIGILDNNPGCTDEMKSGMEIHFHSDHVVQILPGDA